MRVAGVRGNAANMTLNIHGQWGILERLERAEACGSGRPSPARVGPASARILHPVRQ